MVLIAMKISSQSRNSLLNMTSLRKLPANIPFTKIDREF